MSDVLIDGSDQFRHAGEDTATQPLSGDIAEELLDHVQPRRRGWREMHVEAWMLGEPVLHNGMFVRGVVVGNQM